MGFVGEEQNIPDKHFNIEGDINKIRDDVNEIGTNMKDDLPQEENNEQELKLWDEEGEHHDIIEELHNELNASIEENNVIQEHHEEYHEEHHEEKKVIEEHNEVYHEDHHEEHNEENVNEEQKEENTLQAKVNHENPY